MEKPVLIPVILCGGAGSRLWPVSREMHPKPFIRLADGQSLLQKAFLRGVGLSDVDEIIIITNRETFFKAADEIREVNENNISLSYILEPFGRNTAAAVASAALLVAEKNPQALLLVLAADHLIENHSAFSDAVSKAKDLAEEGKLVTFGIHPHAPETGYGYIEADGNKVLRFVEKPDEMTARQYIESGRFLWNSGMFCFKAETIIEEMQSHCPNILNSVADCLSESQRMEGNGFSQCEFSPEKFSSVLENSIDYAVMEKSQRVAVVPCDMGWNDIGSWSALSSLIEEDEYGNHVEGEAVLIDVKNCTIKSEERLVGAVGINDLIIVDTSDALLIIPGNRAQDVKQIYTELKSKGHDSYRFHRTVHRPWGTYTVLEEGDRYKIKRIIVKPGASLSLQMHYHRSEHWIVVSGTAKVINGENETLVHANESTYIPAGCPHRVINPGVIDLVMIEVQSGDYLGEDDIVRFEDVYGRN